ncbi:hypothetical protein EKH57_17470 (plasmid) [Halorubrum sp. BOL3-1]|uniref:uracil-DNA glycosylase family protein n=1 Tax=Halorubrum sp. BOL3-1 TaxID=2497325 RepID=UPI0010050CB1|nr:uracil-DNA glycosylase family protein [Halorubrum sp. BOL3-1]QAU14474.1 hypothetical protein EKH57_17470 [Halorubrum sp. BOL3-1]
MSEYHPADTAANWYGTGTNRNSTGIGPCNECEHRDCNRHYKPFYGYWTGDTLDSEVLLLGEAPGGNAEGGRNAKNASDENQEFDYDGDSVDSDWFTQDSDRSLLDIAKSNNNGFSLSERFISTLVSYDIDSYYTNVKKCNDVHSEQGRETYESARESCAPYLEQELEAVDPSVVVVFSADTQGNASGNFEHCFNKFGLGAEVAGKGTTEIVMPDTKRAESLFPTYDSQRGFKVIPAYHFSLASSNLSQYAEFNPDDLGKPDKSYRNNWKDPYYDDLATKIADLV